MHTAGLDAEAAEDWMHALVGHYRSMRARHPEATLAIVFDIDGTIIDTRYLTLHTLHECDRALGTRYFRNMHVDDIDRHEAELEPILDRLAVSPHARRRIEEVYFGHLWSNEAMLAAHFPYRGVMEVIRWFQLQHRTVVVLNTGRSEAIRSSTIRAMNELGREYRVAFDSDLLFMNRGAIGDDVARRKAQAFREIQERSLRVCAVIDNEPENLEAMAAVDHDHEALFLHASTIFLTARRPVPRSISGTGYGLAAFADRQGLPGHVQLVARADGAADLAAALRGNVRWVSLPVRSDPYGRLEVGRDTPGARPDDSVALVDAIEQIASANHSLRLELQPSASALQLAALSGDIELTAAQLWFSGEFHELGEAGIRRLRERFPASTISCPFDFLAPLVFGALEHALDVIDVAKRWGVTRLGLDWHQPRARALITELERWGYGVDISGIGDAEALLQAVLMMPQSVTAHCRAFVTAADR